MHALISGILIDSGGNFVTTYDMTTRLLASRYIDQFPIREKYRTIVLNKWNSRPFTRVIKLTHSV